MKLKKKSEIRNIEELITASYILKQFAISYDVKINFQITKLLTIIFIKFTIIILLLIFTNYISPCKSENE